MKKLILATVLTAFTATAGLSTAFACDGMKGHEKADKGDQGSSSTKAASGNAKSGAAKTDQKS